MAKTKQDTITRRRARIRVKIRGTAQAPRLSFYASNKHFYAQIVDDDKKITLAFSSDKKVSDGKKKMAKREQVGAMGHDIAAQFGKGERVVFDRGGRKYAGNVKTFADAAREAGLVF